MYNLYMTFVDTPTDAALLEGLLSMTHFPRLCMMCGIRMDGVDDYDWHGYGNCVEITDEMWATKNELYLDGMRRVMNHSAYVVAGERWIGV